MDYNSIKNQEIKGQFIDKHVYCGSTSIVEFILKASYDHNDAPFSYDELQEPSYYEDAQGNIFNESERDDQLETWNGELEELETRLANDDDPQLEIEIQTLESSIEALQYPQTLEIYEWWIVSRYLAGKLETYGQSILNDGMNHYWGRCTTGQAILLDHVISQICNDMEILEGQPNAWCK